MDDVAFAEWRQELLSQAPQTAFICIDDGARAFEVVKRGDHEQARVSRQGIVDSLSAALLFEWARLAE